jgi:acetyltransferase-like isoleucine patch superfamily enzyme
MISLISTILLKFKKLFLYVIVFRANHISYLRHLGVRIGNRCMISTSIENFGTEPWLIEIGNDVSITDNVMFLTHDGASRLFRKQHSDMNQKFGNRFGKIRILDNCFIGINVIIMPGVTIGPNAIVGAGSIVIKNVPAECVVAGNPAKIICTLDEYIEKYKKKMIPINSITRQSLRIELEKIFKER